MYIKDKKTMVTLVILIIALIICTLTITHIIIRKYYADNTTEPLIEMNDSLLDVTTNNPTEVSGAQTTVPATTANAIQQQNTSPAVQTAPATEATVQLSNQQILDMLTNAINKTKSRTDTFYVHRTEKFDANVTQCTGGSLVAGIANKLVGMVLTPSDETLCFSNGRTTTSSGETISILLPLKNNFCLTINNISSISEYDDGNNTVISATLVPETVGMYDIPTANASGIGYLDVSSLDLSFLEVTKASITYTGSTIKVLIDSYGYVIYAEYMVPLYVEGAARAGMINGSATFDGKEIEIWDFR